MDSTRPATALVVGRTPGDGAKRFAEDLDDHLASTYDELATALHEVTPTFLGISAARGMESAVGVALGLLADRPGLTVAVELPEGQRVGEALVGALRERSLPVAGVRHFRDRACLMLGGEDPVTTTDAPVVASLVAAVVRARPRDRHLISSWEVDAIQARALELEKELEETSKDLWDARAEIQKLSSRPGRRGLSARVGRALQEPLPARPEGPPASLPIRLARAASGALGATGRRGRLLTLGVELAVALVLLVVLPVILGVLAGAEGVLVGLLLGALLIGVAGVGALLLRVTRLVAAGEDRDHRTHRDLRLALAQGEQSRTSEAKLESMLRYQGRSLRALPTEQPATEAHVDAATEALGEQVQAMLNLFEIVDVEAAVPAMSHWAASPDLVLWTVDTFLKDRPELVVECGSGVSTLFLALAARQYDVPTRIVAVEHDRMYARRTRELLAHHGVADFAEVRHAPLAHTDLEDHHTPWYDETALADLKGIGLLLVDGPPARTGPAARYPAIPLLKDHLADTCTILVDDLIRDEDREVAERWRLMLPSFAYDVLPLHKVAAVLRRRAAQPGGVDDPGV